MRTNILLRSHSNYKSTISRTIHRGRPGSVDLRGFLRRQRNTYTILRIPLSTTIHNHRSHNYTCTIPTRNRVQQPNRVKLRCRQNFIPPLLLLQRPTRIYHFTNRPSSPKPILPKLTGRPRKLYPSKPISNPTSH